MSSYEVWLAVAVETATAAAQFLRAQWRQTHDVRGKGYRDVVTSTDLAVEALILDHLRQAFPLHSILSEEAGRDAIGSEVVWLIDPLDGTVNFAHNNPNFAVSIAAVESGVPVVGVIADPLRDLLFTAHLGGGAMLNGAPLQTTSVMALDDAVLGFDTPRDAEGRQFMWAEMAQLLERVHTVRATGSAVLNMAYVAAGWLDLYTGFSIEPWDQAAAALLVQEAGGAVGTVSGEPWMPYVRDPVMAATPTLLAGFAARAVLSEPAR